MRFTDHCRRKSRKRCGKPLPNLSKLELELELAPRARARAHGRSRILDPNSPKQNSKHVRYAHMPRTFLLIAAIILLIFYLANAAKNIDTRRDDRDPGPLGTRRRMSMTTKTRPSIPTAIVR